MDEAKFDDLLIACEDASKESDSFLDGELPSLQE